MRKRVDFSMTARRSPQGARVNPGTQAEQHAKLRPGLTLHSVDGKSMAGLVYDDVIGVLKASVLNLSIEVLLKILLINNLIYTSFT